MTNPLVSKAFRLIRPLTAPITTRLATRFRRLVVEANADLAAKTTQLNHHVANLDRRMDAIERRLVALNQPLTNLTEAVAHVSSHIQCLGTIEQRLTGLEQLHSGLMQQQNALIERQDSFDFKLLELARALQQVSQTVRYAPDAAPALPLPVPDTDAAKALANLHDHIIHALLHLQELRQDTAQLAEFSRKLEFIKSHLSSYAGEGVALTYLRDESPLFVNTGDLGCPSPIMNGGVWERENTVILRSFVTDRTTFIDVGANVGYFTVAIGNHLKTVAGKVFAVEPHPRMQQLIERSIQLNGLERVVQLLRGAASDRIEDVTLFYPAGHIGQGSLHHAGSSSGETIRTQSFRLDDAIPEELAVDLIKIDVEGHEAQVLQGMRGILRRSPELKILFEKLAPADAGIPSDEAGAILSELGFELYGVDADAVLVPLDEAQYSNWVGDVLAAPAGRITELDRNRFSIYPQQLLGEGEATATGIRYRTLSGGPLFFGPYWHLEAGTWRIRLHGSIEGAVHLIVAGNGDSVSLNFDIGNEAPGGRIMLPYDLFGFEVRAFGEAGASVALERIEFVRERVPTGPRATASNG
ncbi:FkbM family methyltransferase [Xanthomonas bonasiae]|uniref:FkbM family methyltransferase n=1 Tax=Xanthomonas bonasiae TaxID=2810351 RepID=UPI00197F6966|nr:FkbM family methyltransferase [Xanthomonas bonasiae]MBN6110004.1 FkbM family methyltransferase [Xanthomonas bonasiae]